MQGRRDASSSYDSGRTSLAGSHTESPDGIVTGRHAFDKVIRFVIGAIAGFVLAGFLAIQSGIEIVRSFARFGVVAALVTGAAAVVFGNVFIERFVRGRWWGSDE